VATLRAGPVTELDLVRLIDAPDDTPVVVELRTAEFRAAVDAYEAISDPRSCEGDLVWWNWCRMPAGTSTGVDEPTTVAVMPPLVDRLAEWLDRDLDREPANTGAREALVRALG
jgi:hypothetical protein